MLNQATAPLRLETAKAALGSGLAEVIARVLAILLTIVTARTLEPREVGLLGLAVIVVGVISMIGYYPETAAVASRGESDHNSFALAALIIRGVIIAVLLVLLAAAFAPVADYLIGGPEGRAQFRELLLVLAWAPVLECLSGYPQVVLQRRLDLSFLAKVQLIQPIVFVGLAILLLVQGRGYIGVAWASVIGTALAFLILWARLWRRGWIKLNEWPARGIWRETLVGSSRVFAGGFGGYMGNRLDNFLVAGAMGPTVMSYYSMAWNASHTPSNIFARAIGFVLVPTFARLQGEPKRIERALRDCLQYSYLLLTPTCAVLLVCAPDLVAALLGTKWLPLVPALRLMCISVLAGPLVDASNSLLVGTGRAQLAGIASGVRIVALLLFMQPLAHRWSVIGAAWGDLIAALASAITLAAIAKAAVMGAKWPVAEAVVRPVLAASGAGLLAWGIGAYLVPGIGRLAIQFSMVLLFYPGLVAAIGGRKKMIDLANLLRGAFRGAALAGHELG